MNKKNKNYNFILIGAGRLGTVLSKELSTHFCIKTIIDKDIEKATLLADEINSNCDTVIKSNYLEESDVIIISVTDDEITNVVSELRKYESLLKNKYVFHTSGAMTSEVLSPLKEYGAICFSLHPNASFSHICDAFILKDVPFFYEGKDKKSEKFAVHLCTTLDTEIFSITMELKLLYHSISVMITNFLTSILYFAEKEIFHSNEDTVIAYYKLIDTTVHNFYHSEPPPPITGPAIRGDVETIQKNLSVLKEKSINDLYKLILHNTLTILKENKQISESNFQKINDIIFNKQINS